MLGVFLAVLPIFLLIVVGYVVKRYFVAEESSWRAIDRLVYYIFFPALLFFNVCGADFSSSSVVSAIVSAVLATLCVATLLIVAQKGMKVGGPLFSSVFQGGVRYNSYVFISLAQSLFGEEGAALSGVFTAYMIIFSNIVTVLVMNHYVANATKSIRGTIRALVTNPLIIAALLGLFCNTTELYIPDFMKRVLSYLGSAAMPLALMSVGAGLTIVMSRKLLLAVIYSVSMKLLVMPLFVIVFLKMNGVSGISASVALLYGVVPCAGNAYILARQMGGDAHAMACIINWTVIMSVVTIPLIVSVIAF